MSDILSFIIGLIITCIIGFICVFLVCALDMKDDIWEEIKKKLK